MKASDHALHYIAQTQLAGARQQLLDAQRAGRESWHIRLRVRRLRARVNAYDAREAEERAELSAGIFD